MNKLKYISIKGLCNKEFIRENIYKVIEEHGIETLADLFETDVNEVFKKSLCKEDIKDVIRLLRCVYLDEDPNANIYNEVVDENFLRSLCLSSKVISSLSEISFKDAEDFFKRVQSDEVNTWLKDIQDFGIISLNETLFKVNIILNYYKIHHKKIDIKYKENLEKIIRYPKKVKRRKINGR